MSGRGRENGRMVGTHGFGNGRVEASVAAKITLVGEAALEDVALQGTQMRPRRR